MVSYYRRFISVFSDIVQPLNNQLQNDSDDSDFNGIRHVLMLLKL